MHGHYSRCYWSDEMHAMLLPTSLVCPLSLAGDAAAAVVAVAMASVAPLCPGACSQTFSETACLQTLWVSDRRHHAVSASETVRESGRAQLCWSLLQVRVRVQR
jgi:hypothetical protein